MSNLTKLDTVFLDTKDKESLSTSTTDFEIKFPYAKKDVKRIQFVKFIIPLNQNNITSSNNAFTLDSIAYTASAGWYTITDLCDHLQTDILSGYTVYLNYNSRVVVKNNSSTNFTFVPNTMKVPLGFTQTSYTGASIYYAENLPYLFPSQYFTLHSTFLGARRKNHTQHSDNRSNFICSIPITDDYLDVLSYIPEQPLYIDVDSTNNDIIDFKIKDQSNTVIDCQSKNIQITVDRYG